MRHAHPSSRSAAGLSLALLVLAGCAQSHSPRPPLHAALGGTPVIERVTARMVERMATDPRTRRSMDGIKVAPLAQSLAQQICALSDGPCKYEGETMARVHQGLEIAGSEFDATVQILREELDAAGVSTAAKNELLRRLAPMRRDIVVR